MGIGGGGKTTLASSIYKEICSKFDGYCFLDNIRDKSNKYDLEMLQKKLLYGILKQKYLKVDRVEQGRHMIKSRLCHMRVLIVLDDVDHLDQLNMLAGSHDWFGEGSRIIITTRDMHLLKAHKVSVIYDIRLLNDDESIKLFCKHAPRQDYIPMEVYEKLSKAVVSYASGLPLALKVLGSFLCDKEVNEWMSALTRLKDIPEDDIIGKLKISYDGLKPIEKELFLDIACFHRGRMIEEAVESLDACGFHPIIGIKVLLQKALISVSVKMDEMRFSQGRFDMHDLLQEMGHYIVQGEPPKNLENHSRIWRVEDIVSIRSMSTSMNSDRIEAISMIIHRLDFSQPLPHVLATMKNLRSFHWEYYPPSLLPANFYPTKLRCLILKYSFQQLLWEGYKNLPNLKALDLSYSQNIIKIPDLGGLPVLERMILVGCVSLREIHSSTGCHEKLVFLNLHGCTHLNMFPPITRMPKLTTLILSSCFNLQNFPIIKTNMDSLVDICLRESGIKVLPSSVEQYCRNLVSLDLKNCSHLKSIKVNFCSLKKLKELHLLGCKALETPAKDLFNSVDCCLEVLSLQPTCQNPRCSFNIKFCQFPRFLTSLRLASSELKDGELSSNICELSNLQVLDLADNEFSRIRSNLVQLPRLKFLNISKCKSLVELPDLPSSIAVLDANGCDSLIIRDFPTTYKWLWKVSISYKVPGGENLLQSMFQGNAIEVDHFMSFGTYDYYNSRGIGFDISRGIGFDISTRSFAYETFTLQLPWNWYSDYSGFLICVTQSKLHDVTVIIKQEMHADYQSGHAKEYEGTTIKSMCYIPFSSLMHKALWNGNISFFISECQFKVELVPRRSKGGSSEKSTYCSEFWDEQIKDKKTFTVQKTSRTCMKITWLNC